MELTKHINIHYPKTLVFGPHCLKQFVADYLKTGYSRLYIVTVASLMDQLLPAIDSLKTNNISVKLNLSIYNEPTFTDLAILLDDAKLFKADSIVGIGGGSVLDISKLIAALLKSGQTITDITGIGLLKSRNTYLTCIPTTSGTGSEVSPNAILLDETDNTKKGIISPYLVPDNAYIDPVLTLSLPPTITAYTALDALTHCIEAFTNKYAHPITDNLAIEGIGLIGKNLIKAINNGLDIEARTNLSLGSLYGGMCLGPVNTAAVHALAYPLGSLYNIPHGLSNAVLLPYVMDFNLSYAEKKYASIAIALGVENSGSDYQIAQNGVNSIFGLLSACNIPTTLSELGINKERIPEMAKSALNVQRLLKNNPREVTLNDAIEIYNKAF